MELVERVYGIVRGLLEQERFLGTVAALSAGHASVVRPGQLAPDGQAYVLRVGVLPVVGQRVTVDRYGSNWVITGILPG